MNAEEQGADPYRAATETNSPRAVSAQAIAESIAQADLQIASWLDGLAEKVNAARNQYWRGAISNNNFQDALDRALEEMRAVSRLLRFRPIQITKERR
jgi:hypothetical protein